MHIQSDQRVMWIILRYVFGVPTNPPRGGWRLTARPTDPQDLGQPRGGWGSPPPTAPKTVAHPSGSHIGWRRPPWPGSKWAPCWRAQQTMRCGRPLFGLRTLYRTLYSPCAHCALFVPCLRCAVVALAVGEHCLLWGIGIALLAVARA